MCRRRSRRGCGCWGRADRTRTTRTMATRSRSRRCTHRRCERVAPADHAVVLRLLAKRNRELGSARTRTACRLHALLVELVPGGIAKEITAESGRGGCSTSIDAGRSGGSRSATSSPCEHLDDLRRLDEQMRASKRRLADAVRASGTTVDRDVRLRSGRRRDGRSVSTRNVGRFANRDQFAAYNGTAPDRGRLRRPRACIGCRGAGTANSTMRSTSPRSPRSATRHSPGRAFYDRKLAEGKTKKEAIRALKRRISDALYQRLVADAAKTGPGGQAGTTLQSSVTGITPRQPALRKSHSRTRNERRTPTAPRHDRDHHGKPARTTP